MKKWYGFFDIVIGNPPYIKIQNMDKNLMKQWKFASQGSSDAYIAFIELGINLINNNGELVYITPNSYTNSLAAKNLRKYLAKNKMIKTIVDFEDNQIFDQVTTYPIISVITKKENAQIKIVKHNGKKVTASYHIDSKRMDDEKWTLVNNKTYSQIRKRGGNYKKLSDVAEIMVGIQTLADSIFILTKVAENKKYIKVTNKRGELITLERAITQPIIKASKAQSGADPINQVIICPYETRRGKQKLIEENYFIKNFPLAYAYMQNNKKRLLMRDKGKTKYPWYAFGRDINLNKIYGEKIITSPINKSPNFILFTEASYLFYSGYALKLKSAEININNLLAQLNSEDMNFYIQNTSKIYREGWRAYSKNFIKDYQIKI